jgi:hypothetical protein
MIIANPIYDVVFKYLLEDVEIARELLSTILGEEVQSLEVKPQETATETSTDIHIMRFDFKAVIKKQNGEISKVLIELQKAKQAFNVTRFRRYLGDNYRKEDEVLNEKGVVEKRPLPIVTIYFLGFQLNSIKSGLVHINREYRDIVTGEVLDIKEEFVELLTHDSYIIQVGKLAREARNKLERVLQIFSPIYQNKDDKHKVDFQGNANDPLVKKMLERLGRAIADEEIRHKMDVEDEVNETFEKAMNKKDEIIAEKDEIIVEQEELIVKQEGLIAEKEGLIAEKDRLWLEEKKRAEEEIQKNLDLLRQIEELKKRIGD